MSKYTTEVRYICEFEAGLTESTGYTGIAEVINTAAPKVFNFNFPIFDEAYRLPLEKKILRHYYTREICEETVALWKLRLEDRMNMIMPFYNKLYNSELLQFNPFYDVDLTRDHKRENEGIESRVNETNESANNTETTNRQANSDSVSSNTSDNTSDREVTSSGNKASENSETRDSDISKTETSVSSSRNKGTSDEDITYGKVTDNTHWDLYSDTPQGGINGITGTSGNTVNNNYYLTNARKVTDNEQLSGTDSKDGSTTGTSDVNEVKDTGEIGSQSTTVNVSETNSTTGVESASSKTNESGTIDSSENENTSRIGVSDRNATNTGTANISNTEDYIEHVVGKQGTASYSKMLMEFRDTFLNIDKMVIDALSDLFFGLWG